MIIRPVKAPRHMVNGWRKDAPDARDCIYKAPQRFTALPTSVDLRPLLKPVPVENQGSIGSCTAQALVGIMEYLHDTNNMSDVPRDHVDFSRLFLYYGERYIEGTVNVDAGAQIRSGIKVLAKQGVCREDLWPYSPRGLFLQPNHLCMENAKRHKALTYERITSLEGMKSALMDSQPVAFGFMVYPSFESKEVARTGRVPMPKLTGWLRERTVGGHAVLAVGYDDRMPYKHGANTRYGCVICRNSWGAEWGDDGHFYLPYPFIQSPELSDDFWIIRTARFT
jgi:C1A family cysteine protease